MLELIIIIALAVLLVFSTFITVDLPFFTFSNEVTQGLELIYQNDFFSLGYYSTNLQLLVAILAMISLRPPLGFLFTSVYLALGFSYFPIFYNGGGNEYLLQNSFGYIFGLFPAALFVSFLISSKMKNNQYFLAFKDFLIYSLLALSMIHISGLFVIFYNQGFSNLLLNLQAYLFIPLFSQVIGLVFVSSIAYLLVNSKYFIMKSYGKLIGYFTHGTTKGKWKVVKLFSASMSIYVLYFWIQVSFKLIEQTA